MDAFPALPAFSIAEWIIVGALFFFFAVQLLFYLLLYKKPYSYEKKREKNLPVDAVLPPVSVIIASKNESENLAKNLPQILEQDYPDFEVIVVNSGSTDESDIVLKALAQKYGHLYHTYVPENEGQTNEKKLALTVGIKAAKNNALLFTEAYCKPWTPRWIRHFAEEFAKGKEVVLGFNKLTVPKKTGMRKFILYDNLIQSVKYLSMAISKKPFMGIGRNMAYTRELFFRNNGFSALLNIDGGEDDLLIHKIATGDNTGVVLSPDSMTETDIGEKFAIWRSLKSKYLYTKKFYRGASSFIFSCETCSKYLFYLLTLAAVLTGSLSRNYLLLAVAIVLFIARFWMQAIIVNRNSRLLDAGSYTAGLLFLDIFQPFNNVRFRNYANKRNRKR